MQIGDENVHRVRAVMDEVFGEENFVCADRLSEDELASTARSLASVVDYILWYAQEQRRS